MKHIKLALDPEEKASPVDRLPRISETMGSMTGEEDGKVEAGGWEGTDDATSTAPSDLAKTKTVFPGVDSL